MSGVTRDEFFDLSLDLMCVIGIDGAFKKVNPSWTRILGWSADEVEGKHYSKFLHPADHAETLSFERNFAFSEKQIPFTNRYLKKDGGFGWISWITMFNAEKGDFYTVGRDVTQERRLSRLSAQIEPIAAVGGWEYVVSEKRYHITPGMRRLMDIRDDDDRLTHDVFFELLEPSYRSLVNDSITKLMSDAVEYDIEFAMRTFTGKPIWVRAVARAELHGQEVVRFIGSMQDLTNEHHAHQQLMRAKQQYQNLIESLNDLIWEKDLVRDRLTFVSERQCWDMYGLKAQDVLSNPDLMLDSIHPEDRGLLARALQKAMRDGRSESRYRIQADNGAWRWILDRAKLQCNDKGEPVLLHGIASDITEQVKRDKLLVEQKEKYETIINNIPVFLAYVENDKVEWVNDAWRRSLGWTETDLNDELLLKDIWPVDWQLFTTSQTESGLPCYWVDKKAKTKHGKQVDVAWAFISLRNKNLIAIGQDVSRQRDQERLIVEQQAKIFASAKMSSLGEMAGGVAHEINNPLAIIHARSRQLRQYISEPAFNSEQIFDGLDRIENTVMRIAKIVRGLRSFARNADGDPFVIIPVESVIDDALELCRERFRNNCIDLRFTAESNVRISCRPTQIAQVLLNLLNNAYDAVEALDSRWVNIQVQEDGAQCRIYVTDSGSGIEHKVRERMMEPFFTTKAVGKGTGLGLSIIRGIIEIHNGRFYYDAAYPNTRFVIEIPVSSSL